MSLTEKHHIQKGFSFAQFYKEASLTIFRHVGSYKKVLNWVSPALCIDDVFRD